MSTLKNYDSDNDLYISIAFHTPAEFSVAAAQAKVEGILLQVFKDSEKFYTISKPHDHEDDEITYRIQKPLMISEKEASAFFENLKIVFEMTSDMSPHFTQLGGMPKGA